MKKEKIIIKGATSEVTEDCIVAMVELSIGEWCGNQSFIITKSLQDKEILLGRDFMKPNNVVVDHGADSIQIRRQIKFNNKGDPVQLLSNIGSLLVNNISIKPKVEAIVKCHVAALWSGRDVVFEPKTCKKGIYWSHCVSKVDDGGNILVNVINLTGQ